jgi:DNA-binding MarR family transcriptional regulator
MQLELTREEQTLLANILDEELRDLKEEIYKTETSEYKEVLRARERLLLGLLEKVRAP